MVSTLDPFENTQGLRLLILLEVELAVLTYEC